MSTQPAPEQRVPVEELPPKHRTDLVTLLFTDIVGSSQIKEILGDRVGVALIQRHHALVRQLLERFPEAQEIETSGDSFFIVFVKPSDAVRFALLLQSQARALGKSTPHPIFDRVGIHIGEVIIEEATGRPKRLFGAQVDTCARLMSLAAVDQILLTRAAFDNARQALKGDELEGLGPLSWLNHGSYVVKGREESIEVCEVGEVGLACLKAPSDAEKAQRQVSAESEKVLGWRPALGQLVPSTRWLLENKLGEGGFGEVWLGRNQTTKERRVFKFCFQVERIRFLKRELTLFRILKERIGDHPNIVRLHDVYLEQPPFYVEMDYVEGKDLKTWSVERGGVLSVPLETRLEIVAQAADALQAAHEAGVIHRDVKPANILIAESHRSSRGHEAHDQSGPNIQHSTSNFELSTDSPALHAPRSALGQTSEPPDVGRYEVRAKLTDFGIGQVVSDEYLAGITRAGFTQTILSDSSSSHTGTQIYMAPELLAGKAASPRSDIYSLGVVLYQLLAGDFTRPVTTDWAREVSDPLLREDLGRCFAGNPQERFTSAGQLAKNLRSLPARRAELERQQAEIAARERAAYRRGVLRTTMAGTVILVVVSWLAAMALKQARTARQQARRADDHAIKEAKAARDLGQNLYVADMKLAHLALEEHNLGRAQNLLRKYLPGVGTRSTGSERSTMKADAVERVPTVPLLSAEDLRGFEWRYLWQRAQGQETFSFRPHSNRVSCVVFSPDGKTFLTGGEDQIVKVWETSSRKLIKSLSDVTNPFEFLQYPQNSPSFSPDGKLLALAGKASVVIWETANWQVKARWPNEEQAYRAVFSPGGKTLATKSGRGVQFWETGTWGRRHILETRMGPFTSGLIFSDDGKFLAISDQTRTELWDVFTPTRLDQFSIGLRQALKFSPGGGRLAVGDYEGNVLLWDAVKGHEVTRWKAHRSAVRGLSFSRDGKMLATCGDDQAIHLWELDTQRRLSTVTGHQGRIWAISFSPDGQTLVSASDDGTVKFWNPAPAADEKELKQTLTPLWVSADGRVVATIYTNAVVSYWDVATRRRIRSIPPVLEPNTVNNLRLAPDGKTVAIGRTNAAIEMWNLESRERIATLPNDEKQVLGRLIFSPDQRWLVSAHLSRAAGQALEGRLWNLVTRQVEARFPIERDTMAFSPDGKILATTGTNRNVQLWDIATHRELRTLAIRQIRTLEFASILYALAFSPDGKLLASAGGEFVARVWEVSSGNEVAVMSGHVGATWDVAFSPDGKTLATGSSDRTVKLWNVATWQELMTLPDYGKKVSRLMFSPDGSTLAVGSAPGDYQPGPVQLWRAPSFAEIQTAEDAKRSEKFSRPTR